MDLNDACAALEHAFVHQIIPPEIRDRLVRMVRCEDPGGLPTPFGPKVACPHCRRPLSLTVDHAALPSPQTDRMASVTLLYGSKYAYFLGALILGQNLEKYSRKEKVLLYTVDVPAAYLDILKLYWDCRQVGFLTGSPKLFANHDRSRFRQVFTKFQCLALTEYSKILMLDNDLLIRENIDHLFDLPAPAAMRRHGGSKARPVQHGEPFAAADLWRGPWSSRGGEQNNGLNAGVILLEPNELVYKRMIEEVKGDHVEHCGTNGPEQDYWSRFYTTFLSGTISHIHCQFNYQVGLQDDYSSDAYKELTPESVYVVHYSGIRCKPWELSIQDLLYNDGAVHAKFPIEVGDGTPFCLSKDVVAFIWEWIMDLRLVANSLEMRHGILLPQVIDTVISQLAALRQNVDVPECDRDSFVAALGSSWALTANRQRWVLENGAPSTWVEFRPDGVIWTERGNLGSWARGDAENQMRVRISQLRPESVTLTVTVEVGPDERMEKKFTGPSCEGWPLEVLAATPTKEDASDDLDGWLSDDNTDYNINGTAKISQSNWRTMNYQMSGRNGCYTKFNFCRAVTCGNDIGIGAELQGRTLNDGRKQASSYHIGRIEPPKNGDARGAPEFLPWRGDVDRHVLASVQGNSNYYAARVEPRDPGVLTRWFLCTCSHGSEYRVVSSGKIRGDGAPLQKVKLPAVQLSGEFAKAILGK
eukprot:GEMP01006759.1.p1 GENE.GEMP01006759.1~~GEMP01006759.1.p1  ORF type:complete len:700 (+),score=173.40 GEMP01006759.1:17-2116(+)